MGKRRFRILDTNVLISFWWRSRLWQLKETEVTQWARRLIEVYNTNLIASPVRIEFLCGGQGRENLKLCLAYLHPFAVVDQGQIRPVVRITGTHPPDPRKRAQSCRAAVARPAREGDTAGVSPRP